MTRKKPQKAQKKIAKTKTVLQGNVSEENGGKNNEENKDRPKEQKNFCKDEEDNKTCAQGSCSQDHKKGSEEKNGFKGPGGKGRSKKAGLQACCGNAAR